ncbi:MULTISPECIES: 2'-5' RNA ligase family protein [unclassified Rhizobium]|uniref:2'-5' RNA ligase family protein n=1 Tax=unclassified Rhizobium TaxID=2613769 RepID=UPI0009E74C44|nr:MULTISPECIES: 2'-5' RNA ligase family protein [unclassified Rhizobium]
MRLKTRQPLILTARIPETDLAPFDRLRQIYFPPDRNFLRAHLTMFHRLPGEYTGRIMEQLADIAGGSVTIEAEVTGVQNLGAGVAFMIDSLELHELRAQLKAAFLPWLGPQDMQIWRPHITIQNKVSNLAADDLHRQLLSTFEPHPIKVIGVDLWQYLNGPWKHENSAMFKTDV